MNRIARLAALVYMTALIALAALTACATADTANAPISDVARRVQALLPLDTLLLGEQHDATDHQRIHHDVIASLAARGVLGAVVIEMAQQGYSTRGLDPASSEDGVRTTLHWDDKAWSWPPYAPALMAAVRAGVPVIGANLPREQMRPAMAQKDLDQLLSGPALKAQQQLIRSGHCELLPESQITPMTRIQIARDLAMANTLAQAVKTAVANGSQNYKTVVLLAGSGHVDKALGIPQHLPAGLTSKSVLLSADADFSGSQAHSSFDLVWPSAQVAQKDYCAEMKQKMGAQQIRNSVPSLGLDTRRANHLGPFGNFVVQEFGGLLG